jgi:hypothetical protein
LRRRTLLPSMHHLPQLRLTRTEVKLLNGIKKTIERYESCELV